MARQPLGRGLSSLLGDRGDQETATAGPTEIDIDLIDPNPEQPRTRFSDNALDDLAASITANGIIQPVVVRPLGARYQIVAGERRWRAAQRAGLRRVPVTIREVADDKLLEVALIENIQRQELNPIEEAKAYRKLVDGIGLTQEQVASRVGRERSLVATSLRLLKLPEDIQDLIEEGKLSSGHGRALLMVEDPARQREIARKIITSGFSVRETERTIKGVVSGRARKPIAKTKATGSTDPNVKRAEVKLMRDLGTNVKISPRADGKGGKIEIEYYSSSDLERIYQLLRNKEEV